MDIEAIEAKHYRQFVDTFRANVWNNSDFPVSVEIVISLMDWEFDPHALDRYSTIDLKEQAADDGLTEEGGVEPTDYPKWFKLGKLKAYTVTDSPTLPQPRNIVEKVLAHLSTINRPEPKPFLTAAEYNKDHRTLLDIKRLTMFTFEQNPSISGPWSPGVKNPRSAHGRWN